jgi:hypothetical protein
MSTQLIHVAQDQCSRFEQLQQALAQGWRIESPVYLRAQWYVPDRDGYYFVLTRGNEVDLIVVSAGEAVRQWVQAQRLKVRVS